MQIIKERGLMLMCGYCHDVATFFCPNHRCEGSRKEVCKECSLSSYQTCIDCGSKMVEEDELH